METNDNIKYWDLIAKYHSDECSQEETKELFKWREESNENQILFNQVKTDLEIINLNESMNKVNVNTAWEKVKNRIQEEEQDIPVFEEKKIRFFSFNPVLKYAATVIILLGIGFISAKVYQRISSNKIVLEYAAVNEQGKEITLPDGSTVVLNSESKITYQDFFASNQRRVKLEGEAFFDVTKNPEQAFIIETKDAEVKVLGTSFNVNANIPGHKVEVFVESGLVQLSRLRNGDEKILINPGDIGILNTDKIVKQKNTDKNLVAWKTKEIVFYEDNLEKVIKTLNRVYKTNINCDNEEVLNLKYTSTFKDQDIDSVLNVICLTLDLKTERINNKIYLVKHDS